MPARKATASGGGKTNRLNARAGIPALWMLPPVASKTTATRQEQQARNPDRERLRRQPGQVGQVFPEVDRPDRGPERVQHARPGRPRSPGRGAAAVGDRCWRPPPRGAAPRPRPPLLRRGVDGELRRGRCSWRGPRCLLVLGQIANAADPRRRRPAQVGRHRSAADGILGMPSSVKRRSDDPPVSGG